MISPHLGKLFNQTRSRVTIKDIIDFSPGDPGYPDYVKAWSSILTTGQVPHQSHFDLSETIGLTNWSSASSFAAPPTKKRFIHYRRFTNTVGLILIQHGNSTDCVHPANYLACNLILDFQDTDKKLRQLLRETFDELRTDLIKNDHEPEYPFYTFAQLILAQQLEDWQHCTRLSSQLINDEQAVRNSEAYGYLVDSHHFLLGLTNYNSFHKEWKRFAHRLRNPLNDENTELIINAIIGHPT